MPSTRMTHEATPSAYDACSAGRRDRRVIIEASPSLTGSLDPNADAPWHEAPGGAPLTAVSTIGANF